MMVGTESPFLEKVIVGLPILADLHRGDVLIYLPRNEQVYVAAHAQPHSVPSVYQQPVTDTHLPLAELPAIAAIQRGRVTTQAPRPLAGHRSHIVQRSFAIRDEHGALRGVLAIEKSLVEHERHATRRRPFRRVLHDLRDKVLQGHTDDLHGLPPFRDTDGIVVVDQSGLITYVSGIGSFLYRRLGIAEELIGLPIARQTPTDAALVEQVLRDSRALLDERYEGEHLWIRAAMPLTGPRYRLPDTLLDRIPYAWPHSFGAADKVTVLITIHDATAARRKAQEQAVRHAMMQEIHHRVKNNLQTLASLLRLQSRRANHDETRQALSQAMHRIQAIAEVHEFLSQDATNINLREMAQRITRQVQTSLMGPEQSISLKVEGDPIFLQAQQSTMIALILNELILNALEHGLGHDGHGTIGVRLTDLGDQAQLEVWDTGAGLPVGFDLSQSTSLGLQIIQTIVQDLRGTFALTATVGGEGTTARVVFTKGAPESFG